MRQHIGHAVQSRTAWRAVTWGGAACLLALPWVAMQFDTGVNWTALDFAVMGAMLALACGAVELAIRASGAWTYRLAALAAIGTAFLLVWVNLAVGFIGDEGNPANLMFAGVLGTAAVGSAIARLRARGMAITMACTSIAQGAVGIIARDQDWAVLPATLVFMGAWLVSAGLFALAARRTA